MAHPSYIGPYRIEGEIGRGGLGVVLRGWDSRLERAVAIKVLAGVRDADSDARFAREARVLAALDHPGIAAVYGIELIPGGGTALVMEHVEGQDLADRLRGGPLSVEETVAIGDDVAAALEVAHLRGLVHRDLKPGNLRIRPDGRVKLLDFGLARVIVATTPRSESGDRVSSLPVSTQRGRLLGTPGYMSPEQILGQPVDVRADVFALGCLLYECLTGRRPFGGEDVGTRLAQTLSHPPDLGALPPEAPDTLRNVIERCLEKSRHLRAGNVTWIRTMLASLRADRSLRRVPDLPPSLSRFIGRDADRRRLRTLAMAHRLVTVTGIGGTGKTRLAVETARDIAAAGDVSAVTFIDLTHIDRASSVAIEIARSLGAEDTSPPGTEDVTAAALTSIVAQLGDSSRLILLDNCEQAADPVRLILTDLLRRTTELRVVATSRVALHVSGEQVVPAKPLAVTPEEAYRASGRTAGEGASDADRLFIDRALLVRPDLVFDETTLERVASICRRLDGVPLAIEIAARGVRSSSVNELDERLRRHVASVLDSTTPDDARARTLRDAIEWSVRQLGERARVLFERLSVFSGGCTLQHAEPICDVGDELQTLDALTELVDAGLLFAHSDPSGITRYGMLVPIRTLAREYLLRNDIENTKLTARHADHMLAFVRSLEIRDPDVRRSTDLVHLESEHANVMTAFSGEGGNTQDKLAAYADLQSYWSARGFARAALDVFTDIEARASTDTRMSETGDRARALIVAAELANQCGLFDTARAYAMEALRIRRQGSDEALVAWAELAVGGVAYRQHDYETARAAARRAEDIAARYGDDRLRSRVSNALGGIAWSVGDLVAAREQFEKSASIHRRTGESRGEALAVSNVALVAHAEERFDECAVFAERALALYAELGDRWGVARTLPLVGLVQFRLRRYVDAAQTLVNALQELDALDGGPDLAGVLYELAILAAATGHPESAAEFLGANDALRDRLRVWLPDDQLRDLEPDMDPARHALDEATFDAAYQRGRALPRSEWLERARILQSSITGD